MTALERLRLLAGTSGTTGAALTRLAGTTGLAGALLVAYSGLPAGTAMQHLLQDRAVSGALAGSRPTPITQRAQQIETDREPMLQTVARAEQQLTQRPEVAEGERWIEAAAKRATQIHLISRPANTGGRRK